MHLQIYLLGFSEQFSCQDVVSTSQQMRRIHGGNTRVLFMACILSRLIGKMPQILSDLEKQFYGQPQRPSSKCLKLHFLREVPRKFRTFHFDNDLAGLYEVCPTARPHKVTSEIWRKNWAVFQLFMFVQQQFFVHRLKHARLIIFTKWVGLVPSWVKCSMIVKQMQTACSVQSFFTSLNN